VRPLVVYTGSNRIPSEAHRVSVSSSLQTFFVGTALCAIAALCTADSGPAATSLAAVLAPSQQAHTAVMPATPLAELLEPPQPAHATVAPPARAQPPKEKPARTPTARKRTEKPRLQLAALGTPDIGLAALQSMTEEEALKSLEQEVSLKVGKHIVASDYPDDARRWRWTGTTMIQVLVGTDGLVKAVSLSRSSGFRVLDESALTVVKRVSKLYVPFRLRGREHSVTVPIGFYLKDV